MPTHGDTRIFNGKTYKVKAVAGYIKNAETDAKLLRRHGYYARIIKEKRNRYLIYARKM